MKKSLVALAALAATTAFAQSSVTLYGNMDQSVFRSKSDTGFLLSSNSNGGSTSLWGITGKEDLGGGTTVSFDLKSELTLASGQTGSASTGLNATSSTSTTTGTATVAASISATTTTTTNNYNSNVFNRGAWVGIANAGLGDFKIGRQNDAWWESSTKYNNTGINSFGWANATAMMSGTNSLKNLYGGSDLSAIAGAGAATGATNVGSVGTGGAFYGGISYATPTFAGFQFKYGKGVPKAGYTVNGDANQINSYSLNYANGPLTASYAQQNRTNAAGDNAFQQRLLGVKYVMGQYTFTYGNNKTTVSSTARTTDGGHDATVNAFGVGYALSPKWNLDVGYTITKDVDNSANKWTQTGIVGKYAFSKRTTWYVGYGRSANEGSSRFGSVYAGSANSIPAAAGTSESTIITGLKHAF